MNNEIKQLPVERDEYGFWTHPAWPDDGDECALPKSWFPENGLELHIVEMDGDCEDESLMKSWFDDGDCDCNAWQPSKPAGEGWFVFSIYDTDDGPICVWVRKG